MRLPIPAAARTVIDGGERLLTYEIAQSTVGENRIGMTGRPQIIARVHWRLWRYLNPLNWETPPIEFDEGVAQRWVAGIGTTGGTDSRATRARQAMEAVGAGGGVLVTDRRLLLVALPHGGNPVVHLALPRHDVAEARWRPRLFMAGRVIVRFTDSSTLALMCGMLSPFAARRLRRALSTPS
ncbi:MAG: hypothetical protein QM597_09895 [Aeromicrobium sp.]|uniref:hypothetical protein n=1 Tax=Aeromicrobium sp. TaxID=1871063 RepID=UPI0039E6D117